MFIYVNIFQFVYLGKTFIQCYPRFDHIDPILTFEMYSEDSIPSGSSDEYQLVVTYISFWKACASYFLEILRYFDRIKIVFCCENAYGNKFKIGEVLGIFQETYVTDEWKESDLHA